MNKNTDQEIRLPQGEPYSNSMALSIRRRQAFKIENGQMITGSQYTIDGKRYKVNSVFDLINSKNCEEGIKNLISLEIDKVS